MLGEQIGWQLDLIAQAGLYDVRLDGLPGGRTPPDRPLSRLDKVFRAHHPGRPATAG